MKNNRLFIALAIVAAVGAVLFVLSRRKPTEVPAAPIVTENPEIAAVKANVIAQRAMMKARFDKRSQFMLKEFPLPRKKDPAFQLALKRIQNLQFLTQDEFDLYDQLQSRAASRVAEEIARAHKEIKGSTRLQDWVHRLEIFDRTCEQVRAAYVAEAKKARSLGLETPSFRAEDQLSK